MKENKKQFNNFLVQSFNKLGPGLYCHDLIIQNNQLYLTELGYKSYDPYLHNLIDFHKIKLGKKFEKIQEYIKFYNDTILNYKY